MGSYLTLTKVLVKCGIGSNSNSNSKFGGGSSMALTLVCTLPIITMITRIMITQYSTLVSSGSSPDSIISQGTSIGMFGCLILGFTMILSTFYTSTDISTLMQLPLSAQVIAAAKWTVSLLYDYSMILCLTAPALLGYGIGSHAGVIYWVIAVVVCILLPMTPLIYGSIISMLVMRVFRRMHNKQLVTIIGMAVTFVFLVMMIAPMFGSQDGENASTLAMMGSFEKTSVIFPNLSLADLALTQGSLLHLALFIVSIAGEMIVFLLVAKAVYFKSVIGMSESVAKRGKLSDQSISSFENVRDQIGSFERMERSRVLRSPTYLMQCALTSLIWPAMAVITGFISVARDGGETSIFTSFLTSEASSEGSAGFLFGFTLALVFLTASSNMISSTAISREGHGFSFLKSLPMAFRDLIDAKVRSNIVPSFILSTGMPLVIGIIGMLNGMSPLIVILSAVAGFALVVLINYLQIRFDLMKPNLAWEDETSAIKMSNAQIAVFVCFGVGIGVFALYLAILFFLELSPTVAAAIVTAATAGMAAFVRARVLAYGERRMRELS